MPGQQDLGPIGRRLLEGLRGNAAKLTLDAAALREVETTLAAADGPTLLSSVAELAVLAAVLAERSGAAEAAAQVQELANGAAEQLERMGNAEARRRLTGTREAGQKLAREQRKARGATMSRKKLKTARVKLGVGLRNNTKGPKL